MSTSTVSRVEEHSRMADVEASFEDRYSRLKLVALKLKKKTVDQDKRIKELTTDQSSNPKMATLTQNCATLQSKCDELADLVDEQKAKLSALGKDLESKVSECADAKLKLAESQESNKKLVSDREALSGAEKRQNELDLELEKAEKKVEELTQSCDDSKEKVTIYDLTRLSNPIATFASPQITELEENLKRETDLKAKAEELSKEVQLALNRETGRADDLKVAFCLIHLL